MKQNSPATPKTPVTSADIGQLLAMQSQLPCRSLDVRQLAAALAEESDQPRVLIIDAEEDEQLDEVIAAVASRARQTLLVGSAGDLRGAGALSAPGCGRAVAGGGRLHERNSTGSGRRFGRPSAGRADRD